MEFENYADVIDAFERDDMGYENLTAYIEGENIKIKDPGFKDGGLMVAIQKFANGGGIGSMMQPKSKTGKAINQLQSKAPEGEFLAYINPDEAAMLKRAGGSGEPVNGIPSFRPQDMGNKSNQKSSASRTSSSSKSSSKGTGGSKGNLGGGGGGQGTTYRSYRAPTKPTYTAKTIDSKPVTGNDYRDSRNDFVNTLNKNNQIAAAQNNTRFTPYQGGARTSSYYNPNPLSGLLKLAAGFAFPGANFFLNKGSKLKDGLMNLNDSIQNSDFGRSTSFADYKDIKSFGGYDEREMAKQINKDEAKNLQARIDGGEFDGFERPTQTFTFDNSKMKPPAEVKGLDTSFYENENSIGMGSAPTGVMKPGGFTNALYDGRYAPVPNNSTPYTMGSVPFSPALGNTQPQELSMMEKYYNDIDNKATGPNIVQDASEIAQQAKVFGLQDLQGIGALEEGKVFGYNTTDQGDALEKFRNSAVNFYNSPNNTNKTPQSAYDFMMNTNPNMFKDVKENKDYILNAINQGFLENQTDYKNQPSLEDFT